MPTFGETMKNIGTGTAIGAGTAMAGGLIGALGIGNKQQQRQQQKLTQQAADINYNYGEKAARNAFQRQKEMYQMTKEDESYKAQVKDMKEAGLSIGLMGGAGTGAGGMGAVSGGSQADTGATGGGVADSPAQKQMMGMEMMRLGSEIEVNKSIAQKNTAEAENTGAQTKTEEQKREAFIENIKQEGYGRWLENVATHWKYNGPKNQNQLYENKKYGYTNIFDDSYYGQETAANIAKAWGDANNNQALAELNTEKKKGYWTELMNATAHAEADKVKAAAIKLAAEWDTGEQTNWKTWVNVAKDVFGAIIAAAK